MLSLMGKKGGSLVGVSVVEAVGSWRVSSCSRVHIWGAESCPGGWTSPRLALPRQRVKHQEGRGKARDLCRR